MTNQTTLTKDFYERTSERFWDPTEGMVGRDNVVFPLLEETTGVALEYGFGSGSLLMGMARSSRYTQVIGVEIAATLIARFNTALEGEPSTISSKVELVQPEGDRLPNLESASVDVIVSVATIEHVINPYVVLDELYRIAKPGATLVCSVPNYAYLKHRISLLMGQLPQTGTDDPVENWRECGWDGMHLHCFTQTSFEILLRDCGWEPIRWTGWGTRFGWLGRLRQRYAGLLSGEIIAMCRKIDQL
jgi:SAM-dependent methyltransferase